MERKCRQTSKRPLLPYDAATPQLEPYDDVKHHRESYDAVIQQCHRHEPYGQTANESAFPFVLRRNLSKRMASGSEFVPTSGSNRGSFYMSGTMSESTSRDGSPTRSAAFVRRQLSPYPVAPPSMIITPSRTSMRAEWTAARTGQLWIRRTWNN